MKKSDGDTNEYDRLKQKGEMRDVRPAPLWGMLVCAAFIVVAGVYMTIRDRVAAGYLPPGRVWQRSNFGMISGPGAIALGLVIAVIPAYNLWKWGRHKSRCE
jgi:hypothetical protein